MTTLTIWQRTNEKDGIIAACIAKKLKYTVEFKDPRLVQGAPTEKAMPVFFVDNTKYTDLKALVAGLNFDIRTL